MNIFAKSQTHNREGVIRSIQDIKPLKSSEQNLRAKSLLDDKSQITKTKFNVFESYDTEKLNREKLKLLGGSSSLQTLPQKEENTSQLNSDHSSSSLVAFKSTHLAYLGNQKDQRESTRDFIDISRKMLISQIQINDKNAESKALEEYIELEIEKLEKARRDIEEDKERF